MAIRLKPEQADAVRRMHNGCLLCGDTGSGKSIVSLAYYFLINGGDFGSIYEEPSEGYVPMNDPPMDLYIITPAKKRNDDEWRGELCRFLMAPGENKGIYQHKVVVDSWNNLHKYLKVKDAFFIFDEDKITGDKAWAHQFIKITKNNQWIVASATPGDCWKDYAAIFVANGYYRSISEFKSQHIVYNPHVPYPQVKSYINTGRLLRLRKNILVNLDVHKETIKHMEYIYCDYDKELYKDIVRNRWNYDENKPIENASEYCSLLRRCVNSSEDRISKVLDIFSEHRKVIIFYNYNYELEDLKNAFDFMSYDDGIDEFTLSEWNGQVHQDIPKGGDWVYLVQFNACEAWNCVNTDTIIFYSLNYSYKNMYQAAGRIDRLNTPYKDLYYYHLTSKSGIDLAIMESLKEKKKFNEGNFARI